MGWGGVGEVEIVLTCRKKNSAPRSWCPGVVVPEAGASGQGHRIVRDDGSFYAEATTGSSVAGRMAPRTRTCACSEGLCAGRLRGQVGGSG